MDQNLMVVEENRKGREMAPAEDMLAQLARFLRLTVAEGDASEHTLRTYYAHIRQFFAWCAEEGVHPAGATRDDLIEFRRYLVDKKDYKRGTVAYKLNAVRRFYEAALAWGLRADNPAEGLKAPKDPTSRRDRIVERYISPEDMHLLLSAPPADTTTGIRDRAILALFYYHGLRVSEVCRVDMADLIGGKPFQVRLRQAKGGKDRSVFLVGSSMDPLQRWLETRQSLANVKPGLNQPVFVSLDRPTFGTRLTPEGVRWVVDGWLSECGLKRPGVSCHALRHAYATHVMMKKPELLFSLSQTMGHAAVTTTQAYVEAARAMTENPAAVLEEE